MDYRRLAGDEDSASPEAPAAVAAPAAAARPAGAKSRKRQPARKTPKKSKKKRRRESYSGYIYKVLKSIDPDKGVSSRGMAVLNDMVSHLFGEIAGAAKSLVESSGSQTIKSRDIESAVLLVCGRVPLGSHAVKEGQRALTNFMCT